MTKFAYTVDEVTGSGDMAYARGTYAIEVTLPDGVAAHEQGTYLQVHRKQQDGKWPYARLSWHSSEPPAAPSTQ